MNIRFLFGAAVFSFSALVRADLVLVANPGIGISSISQTQISRLFLGQAKEFSNGAKATPLDVSGPAKDQFAQQVLKKSPEQVEKYWARTIFTGKAMPPREVKPEDLKATLASSPGAISYMEKGQVDNSVKVIAVTQD